MKELAMIMAHAMPLEELVGMLEKEILKWKIDPSEKNKGSLQTICMLIMAKSTVETKDDLDRTMASMARTEKAMELLSPKGQ